MANRIKRSTLNSLIDASAFVMFVLMTTTGLVLRWSLPPGSGRLGHGEPGRAISLVWGLTRHQWGELHFWLAVALLGVLSLHLLLHWRFIVNLVRGRPRQGSGSRLALAVVALASLLAVAAAPLCSPMQTMPRWQIETSQPSKVRQPGAARTGVIRGSMTLRDVARATGVPIATLTRSLGLPQDVSPDERLGRLRRRHGFGLDDVRAAVDRYTP